MGQEREPDADALHERAYRAMDDGALDEASRAFGSLLERFPASANYHYMRGLAHKYMLDWPTSLRHNLRAVELATEPSAAERWNAAIAATGAGDWAEARRQWQACGIRIPEGDGPINGDFGIAVVRLHPWDGGETVFVRRIDPVRARLLNVPLPESGHRFGDIVLHDGASTGQRHDGDTPVHVFNALGRLQASDYQTFMVFVDCATPDDVRALLESSAPGIGHVEDWTESVRFYCLRCSYGAPHRHQDEPTADWQVERNLGIAAQSRHSVDRLLRDWAAGGPGRRVDAVETRECAVPEYRQGHVWWRSPEDDASP